MVVCLKRRLGLLVPLAIAIALLAMPVHATMNPQASVTLDPGNILVLRSDQKSLQNVVVEGNISAATYSRGPYPSANFTLATNSSQSYAQSHTLQYVLNVTLSNGVSSYSVFLETHDPSKGTTSQVTSYYVSSAELDLTVNAVFQPSPSTGPNTPIGLGSFYEWLTQFGGAFPLWVKILYFVLGIQFAFVGYRWIKFEDDRRRLEGHLPPLDRGNKLYMWTDIAFRGLLTGFAITLIVMIGEVLVTLIAQDLLFVNTSFVSLFDFFSLFFVIVVASVIYLAKEGFDRFLDLKPMMED